MAFLQPPTMSQPRTQTPPSPSPSPPKTTTSLSSSDFFSQRSRKQLGLFLGGVGFLAISTMITRRSIIRRYKASLPKFYQPSNRLNFEVNGAVEAFEALNIATINVISVGMMVSGGMLWALDISDIGDMRRLVRRNLGVDGGRGDAESDKEAEEEIEEWFASVLARKEFKALRGEMGVKDGEERKVGEEGEKEGITGKREVREAWENVKKS